MIAHLVTFPVADDELCRSFDSPCQLTGDEMPAVGASIVMTAWEGGAPRIDEDPTGGSTPTRSVGEPAAFRIEREMQARRDRGRGGNSARRASLTDR